jgi:uncharacterized protein (DUF305 family)
MQFQSSSRRHLCLLAVLCLGAASTGKARAASAEAGYLAANNAAMDKMMADMAVHPSGDADADFVAMMVPHHQGAIDMASAELLYGHNQQLIRVAQGIIVEEMQEIAAMRLALGQKAHPSWVVQPQPMLHEVERPGADAGFIGRNSSAMNIMMTNMAVRPTGDVDRDFAAMMIPHHQGGIAMAQAELQYGHNPQLGLVAQEIIVDQQQDIVLMRLALGQSLPAPRAARDQGNLPANTN